MLRHEPVEHLLGGSNRISHVRSVARVEKTPKVNNPGIAHYLTERARAAVAARLAFFEPVDAATNFGQEFFDSFSD